MRIYNSHGTKNRQKLEGSELASFPSRAFALIIDFFIGSLLFIPVALAVVFIEIRFLQHRDLVIDLNFYENWYSIAWFVFYFGLSTYLGNGQTIGKRLLKIRVISLVHTRMSLWHSIERALGYGASILEFGFGFIQYFIHPNRRTVHDRIAETIVVKENRLSSIITDD